MMIARNVLFGLVAWGFGLALTPESTQAQVWSEYWVSGAPVTIDRGGPLRNFFGRIHDRWHGVQYYAPVGVHRLSWYDPCCDICCCVPFCWDPCCFPVSSVYVPPLANSFHLGRGFESTIIGSPSLSTSTQWVPSQPKPTINKTPDQPGGSVLEKENAPEPPSTDTPERIETRYLPGSFDSMLASQNQAAPQPQVASDEWFLELSVPVDAQIEINGRPTRSTGSNRKFSVQLKDPQNETPITVHTFIRRDEQTLAHTEVVHVRGGNWQKTSIAESDMKAMIQTTLIVKVPSSAQLSLAGTTLPPGKELRTFVTRKLEAGKVWTDYCVRAEIEQNGELVVVERFIDVVAGQEHVIDLFPSLEDAALAKR